MMQQPPAIPIAPGMAYGPAAGPIPYPPPGMDPDDPRLDPPAPPGSDDPEEAAHEAAWIAERAAAEDATAAAELEAGHVPDETRAAARPELLYSGTFALYRTPAGLFHLSYRPTAATDDDGNIVELPPQPDRHLRDMPERAADLIFASLNRDVPLHPMVDALLFKGVMPNPVQIMAAMKEYGAALSQEAAGNVG